MGVCGNPGLAGRGPLTGKTMTNAERRQRIDATMAAISDVFVPESGGARMAGRVAYLQLGHLYDLFDGVVLLLARARAHPAFILGRSTFETSLRLGALENPATRDAIAARWFNEPQARAPKLISALAAAGEDVTRAFPPSRDQADTQVGLSWPCGG